jgi:hypothetical protein
LWADWLTIGILETSQDSLVRGHVGAQGTERSLDSFFRLEFREIKKQDA